MEPAITFREAISGTLAFYDIFEHPLTAEELTEDLIRFTATAGQVKTCADGLKNIQNYDNFYFLSGRRELISKRYKRRKAIEKAWRRVKKIRFIFALIPFVQHVSVCNNLSMNTYDERSDIDLFIITTQDRLFFSRFLITLFLQLWGLRRHGKKISGRFCLSFFITPAAFDLDKVRISQDDIYLAYWIKKLVPIYDQKDTFDNFVKANSPWLKEFFPRKLDFFKVKLYKAPLILKIGKKIGEFLLNGFIGNHLEWRLQNWQMARAWKKKSRLKDASGTVISRTMLKFHDCDMRFFYLKEWKRRLKVP